MRVLFIHNRYRQQGGEDVVMELESSILAQKGHDVKVMLFDNNTITGFLSYARSLFSSFYNAASARKLVQAIHDFKPDVVHVHNIFFIASPSVLVVAKRHKVPVVFTLHNYRLICGNALLLRGDKPCNLCVNKKFPINGILHKCYRNSYAASILVTSITAIHKYLNTWKKNVSAFITINQFAKDKFQNSALEIPAKRFIVKPNFVTDPGVGVFPRKDFFLFTGRLVKEKGVDTLLNVFAEMPEKKLIIIGEGPEKMQLLQQYRNCKNISFKGDLPRNEVENYLKQCKAFVCPSLWQEGPPLTLIEALATGTPVLASNIAPNCDTIIDGYNGFLFNAGDKTDLNQKLNLMELHYNEQLHTNARLTYLEKFHPDIHYKTIMNIYNDSIENYTLQN